MKREFLISIYQTCETVGAEKKKILLNMEIVGAWKIFLVSIRPGDSEEEGLKRLFGFH